MDELWPARTISMACTSTSISLTSQSPSTDRIIAISISPLFCGGADMGAVCVIGSLNIDLVTRVERHPRPGETVAGNGLERLPGGKGANQALAAARAGARTLLCGR